MGSAVRFFVAVLLSSGPVHAGSLHSGSQAERPPSAADPVSSPCALAMGALAPAVAPGERFALLQSDALRALRERFPEIAGVDVRPSPTPPAFSDVRLDVVVSRGGRPPEVVGHIEYVIGRGMLDYDVRISDPAYRGAGLNHLLLAGILRDHPSVQRISACLLESNLRAFLTAATGRDREVTDGGRALLEHWRSLDGPADHAAFRQRLIDAYLSGTPAGRTGVAAGFGAFHSLQITLTPTGHVEVQTIVGREPSAPGGGRVLVTYLAPGTPVYRELYADGTVRDSTTFPFMP